MCEPLRIRIPKRQGARDGVRGMVPRLVDGPPMAAAGRAARGGRAHRHAVLLPFADMIQASQMLRYNKRKVGLP